MTVAERIASLKRPLQDKLNDYKEAAPHPFPQETGLLHPYQDVGVHLRDDGALEMFAGDVSIILDGESGSIILKGVNLISSVTDTSVLSEDSLSLNNHSLSYGWLPDNKIEEELKSPCTLINKAAIFLSGTPAPGQYPVAITSVISPKPLFKAKKQNSYLEELSKLL